MYFFLGFNGLRKILHAIIFSLSCMDCGNEFLTMGSKNTTCKTDVGPISILELKIKSFVAAMIPTPLQS